MAELRDKVWRRLGGLTNLVALDTNQGGGFSTTELVDGAPDERRIRLIPYGELARTQDLLHAVEDLIENDRRINNEKNAGHSILCEGVFNEVGADFGVELIYDSVQQNKFKELKVTHGKFKTNATIYETTLDVEYGMLSYIPASPSPADLKKYVIHDLANTTANRYRRDYISIVYHDTDANPITNPGTPYWRYVEGDTLFSEPVLKHRQKIYESGVDGELWPASMGKFDANLNPAKYREFIIYSLLFYYNNTGTWQEIDYIGSGATLPDPNTYTIGQHFELIGSTDPLFFDGLYIIYNAGGTNAWQRLPLDVPAITGIEFPTSPADLTYYKINGLGDIPAGWYQFHANNDFTELKEIEIVPPQSGIADIVNFIDGKWVYVHKSTPVEYEMYKVSGIDRELYHPFRTFTPLGIEYGQGASIIKEGTLFKSSEAYRLNRLMYDYVNLNSQDTSLYNFPFRITEVENDFSLSDTVKVDHILLAYPKDGYWNGDFVHLGSNYHKLTNGAWSTALSLYARNSWLPESPVEDDYFEIISGAMLHGLYIYTGGTWNIIPNAPPTQRNIRRGSDAPHYPINMEYFEVVGSVMPGISDGLYQYYIDVQSRWGHFENATFFVETPYVPHASSPGNEFPFPNNTDQPVVYFKATGNGSVLAGWWRYSGGPLGIWIQIDVAHGDTFPGGQDSQAPNQRWNEIPVAGEYFKADGTGNMFEGWWRRTAADYWETIVVHYGDTLPIPFVEPAPGSVYYFESNGLEVSNGGPAEGIYEYKRPQWEIIPYEEHDEYPTVRLFNGKHFYATGNGNVPEGLYRYTTGVWVEVTKIHASSPGNTYPFNASAGTPADDGTFWKSTGLGDPATTPKRGWYRFDYDAVTWQPIHTKEGNEYPTNNLFDHMHFESLGGGSVPAGLYHYDADVAYWKLIPPSIIGGPTNELPAGGMQNGDYHSITGLGSIPKGYYRYTGRDWLLRPHTDVYELPPLEDDFQVRIIAPRVFTNLLGSAEVVVTKIDTTSPYRNALTGSWEIKVSEMLEYRNRLNGIVQDVAIGDCVLITDGMGKNQIGYITHLFKGGNPYTESIVVAGLYTDIESTIDDMGHLATSGASKLLFFSATGYSVIDEILLTKVQAMAQIDEIDAFVPGQDPFVDESIFPKRISDIQNIYEIKFNFSANTYINKGAWYIIMCRSQRAAGGELTWDPPRIAIANVNNTNIPARTGYYNIRYLTTQGKYPYYGIDEFGNPDYNLKYFVIEDTCDGGVTWKELQENSTSRISLFTFSKFKVIAKNLDDVNAPLVYQWLSTRTVTNEVYVDVVHGRLMFHPNITSIIQSNPQYDFRVSFIILNILTGYISTDYIVHNDVDSGKQYILYNIIKELQAGSGGGGGTSERKLFNYRGKWAKIYIPDSTKPLQGFAIAHPMIDDTMLATPNIDDLSVYFCEENGNPIINMQTAWKMNYREPISRLVDGDPHTLNCFLYNEAYFKDDDYYLSAEGDMLNRWWHHNTGIDSWEPVTYSYGPTFPPTPITDAFHYLINVSTYDDGLYQYNGTDWIKITNLAIASGKEPALPTNKYVPIPGGIPLQVENSTTPEGNRAVTESMYAWATSGELESTVQNHRFVGVLLSQLGSNWNNLCMIMHDEFHNIIGTETLVPFAQVEAIFNNTRRPTKDRWIYFMMITPLTTGVNYHYHFYIDVLNSGGTTPHLMGYIDGTNAKGFFKVVARPFPGELDGGYPDNFIMRLVYADSGLDATKTHIAAGQNDALDVIDPSTNRPLSESDDYSFVWVTNLADNAPNGIWERWAYGNNIAYDPRLGRIKFPETLDPSMFAIEFNASWQSERVSAKAVGLSINPNASVEDIFDLLNLYRDTESILEFVEERIARYAPQENKFIAAGTPGERFQLSFTPAGYAVDANGQLIYEGGTYVGSDAAKRALIVSVNSALQSETNFELYGKQIGFNEVLNPNDVIVVRGAEYRVLTTVANHSITPDHFSSETQALIQELRNIRDVDVPVALAQAKIEIMAYVDGVLAEAVVPQENNFRINGGNIQRYNENSSTWENVAVGFNNLPLTWTPLDKKSVLVIHNNIPQTIFAFELTGLDENVVSFTNALAEGDNVCVKGNIVRPAVYGSGTIQPAEDTWVVSGAPRTEFQCSFLIRDKEYAIVSVGGVLQSKDNYMLTNNSQPASVTGSTDLSGGFDWATTNQSFNISVNGQFTKTITLNAACADAVAVKDHINARLAVEGITEVQASVVGNNIKLQSIEVGLGQTFTLSAGTTDALVTLGWPAAVYNGIDGVSTVTFDTPIGVGVRVIVKNSTIISKMLTDGEIQYRHLSSSLKLMLGI